MKCHKVDYAIAGDDLQLVEVELDPNEKVIAEAGVMNFMDEGITFEAKLGDGSSPDVDFFGTMLQVGKRLITRETLFLTHFTNQASSRRRVAFAAPYPGKILPLDLSAFGGELLCQKDSFLCAAFGTNVGIAFSRRIGAGLFGGEGFILQRLRGDGMVFLHAGGTLVERELRGETLRVDTGCLVAFTPGIDYDIALAGGLRSMIFGGEGLFLTTLKGQGRVWLQSLPFSRLADRILANAPSRGGKSADEGSILGRLGRLVDGS